MSPDFQHNSKTQKPIFIFIVGPTATGKSKLALFLAARRGGEIINCDSIQVYRSLQIGSDQPSDEVKALSPHHLYGFLEDGARYSAGRYRRDVMDLFHSRLCPFYWLVGGSGFYVQSLLTPMYELSVMAPEIRKRVAEQINKRGVRDLYDELALKDPAYAARLSSNDSYRVARAWEIIQHTGQKVSDLHESSKKKQAQCDLPFHPVRLGLYLDKDKLKNRLEIRTQRMLKRGLIDEVELIRNRGFHEWAPLRCVGYKEVGYYLDGKIESCDLGDAIVAASMRLAKKQMTWFRRDKNIRWFNADSELKAAESFILESLFLSAPGPT